MASDVDFVAHVCGQAGLGNALSYRKMFGEYALYLDGRVVALVCDNMLFVKPTDAGRALLGAVEEAPPYPGASRTGGWTRCSMTASGSGACCGRRPRPKAPRTR